MMAEYEWNWQKMAITSVVRGYHVLRASAQWTVVPCA